MSDSKILLCVCPVISHTSVILQFDTQNSIITWSSLKKHTAHTSSDPYLILTESLIDENND